MGNAIHAVQDATSPSHKGFQEFHMSGAVGHVMAENKYPKGDRAKALEGATKWMYNIWKGKESKPTHFFDPKTGGLLLPKAKQSNGSTGTPLSYGRKLIGIGPGGAIIHSPRGAE
ncbi:MAG: hypothetical protein HOK41_06125 [Nitrospina sp.]|nr:hypothetical protein [Nitrospina sp.]